MNMLGSRGKSTSLEEVINFFGDFEKVKQSVAEHTDAVLNHKNAVEEYKKAKAESDEQFRKTTDAMIALTNKEADLLEKGTQLANQAKELAAFKVKLTEDQRQVEMAYDHVDALYEDADHEHEAIINAAKQEAKRAQEEQWRICQNMLDEALKRDEYSAKIQDEINRKLADADKRLAEIKQREVSLAKRESVIASFATQLQGK